MTALGFTVHVLIDVSADGVTDEATREFPTWEEAVQAAAEIPAVVPAFRMVSIFRSEDFPRFMQGAATRA